MSESCCQNQNFERHPDPEIADIGHGEGVEFTIGRCGGCRTPLIRFWVGGGIAEGMTVISQEQIEAFVNTQDGMTRKRLLCDWFDSL